MKKPALRFLEKILAGMLIIMVVQLMASGFAYSQTSFTEVSQQAGVSQVSPTWGISWGDVNNDGFEDIYIGNHHYALKHANVQTPSALFLNKGDLTFQNVASDYGIIPTGDFHGAIWGDYNNDGFSDLFQTRGGNRGQGGAPNRLYRNLGTGLFEEIGVSAGVGMAPARGRGGFWMDYDLDGLLDLYIANERFTGYPGTLMRNNGDDTFTDVGAALGLSIQGVIMGSPVDFNNDDRVDIFLASREQIGLLQNNGDGTFSDVTAASGLSGTIYSQGFSWGDYDNDGDMDLYVASAFAEDTFQWNSGGIHFMTDVFGGGEKGVDLSIAGTTVTFDIYGYEVLVDPLKVYIGAQGIHPFSNPFTLAAGAPEVQGKPNFTPGAETAYYVWEEAGTWFIRSTTITTRSGESFGGTIQSDGSIVSAVPFNFEFVLVNHTNKLYENMGDGTFVDVAQQAGVADTSLSISAVWTDFDNDGWLDLYVVNLGEIFNAPNRLYMNNGDKTFTETGLLSNVEGGLDGRGENAAVGDYDNNGFIDIFVANGYGQAPFSFGPHLLYHNNGNNNHWLKIKLVGKRSNREGVGSRVTARVGQASYLRQQTGGASRFSQNTQLIHFGIGPGQIVDEVTITWPSGIVQTLQNVSADQTLVLTEPTVRIDMAPEANIYLPGDKLRYQLTVTNETNLNLEFDFWTNVILPNGNRYPTNELIGPELVNLSPFSITTKVIHHDIPLNAVPGGYSYHGLVGLYPNFWNEGSFTFTIGP